MATESDGDEDTAAAAGKLTGSDHLSVEDDLREMAKKAAWSVSSCKPGNGVLSLRDDNLDTYWQSDGAQPHLVNIQFQKKVKLQLLVLYVDFKLDESYTPSKISIRAGDGFHNLKEIKTVELVKPVGWVHISLSGTDPRSWGGFAVGDEGEVQAREKCPTTGRFPAVVRERGGIADMGSSESKEPSRWSNWVEFCMPALARQSETFIHTFMLQLAVLSNHLNGRDTHIRQIKVYGPRPNPVPHQPFHFTSQEFITYSTIR